MEASSTVSERFSLVELSAYPLRDVSDDDLKGLVRALWDWKLCEPCQVNPGQRQCKDLVCPGTRWNRMATFFSYYKTVTAAYVPDMVAENPPALGDHSDLFAIIHLLRQNPDTKRSELTYGHFISSGNGLPPTGEDQNRAFDLALRVMTTMTCSLQTRMADTLEAGLQPIIWGDDMSWTQFVSSTLPATQYSSPDFDDGEDAASRRMNEQVTGRRLIKVARLRFVPTNELGDHLKLNRKDGTVGLYQQTAFLKESVIASQADAAGHIPRKVANEVLDSIQRTLFPSNSADSQLLLRSLVSKHSLDPDCLNFEPSSYRLEAEGPSAYRHFGPRLVDLYEELESPTPRGRIEKWLERRSGARYVMLATLGGLAIAILLGALALIVSIFQAWVAWQQWKHPIDR